MHLQNNVLWQTRDALRIKEEGCLFLGLRVMEPSARAQSPSNKVMFINQLRFGLFSAFLGFLGCFGIHQFQSKKRLLVLSFYETKSEICAGLDQLGSLEFKNFEQHLVQINKQANIILFCLIKFQFFDIMYKSVQVQMWMLRQNTAGFIYNEFASALYRARRPQNTLHTSAQWVSNYNYNV